MAKVKDGKIIKDEKKEAKKKNFLGGTRSFSIKKGKSVKQQRSDIIKGRDERLKADAKKQGITVDQLKKKRSDTFSTVLAPLTLAPAGRAAKLLGKGASKIKNIFKSKPKATTTKTTTTTTSPKSTGGVRFSRKKPATTTKKQKQQSVLTARKQKQAATKKAAPKTTSRSRVKSFVAKNKKPLALGAGVAAGSTALLSGSKKSPAKKPQAMPKPRPKNIKPTAPKKVTQNVAPKMKRTNITAGKNTGFGPKGNIFASSEKRRKELMEKYGGTGSAAAKAAAQGTQGNMVTRAAGGLKPVPEGNKGKGLSKLPTEVRNKMGFMKKGGKLTSNKAKINKVTSGLKKAVKAHTGQAKMLSSIKLKKGGKMNKNKRYI